MAKERFPQREWLFGCVVGIALSSSGAMAQVQGRVVSERGLALAATTVWSDAGPVKTDSAGEFSVPRLARSGARVVRVSRNGYQPVTKVFLDGAHVTISMKADANALWKPSICRYAASEKPEAGFVTRAAMYSGRVRLSFPVGTKIKKTGDIESSANKICRGRECLSHSWDAVIGDPIAGIITPDLMTGITILAERDVYDTLHDFTEGAEYRGVRGDGSRFRWIGLAGERIIYDHASAASAEYFDRIVDSLCWLKPSDAAASRGRH